jgi:high-affinity iron transporter
VLTGAGVGLLVLAVLVAIFQRVGKRLQPRPLLVSCGVLLCGLAVVMVGKGIHGLQEAGLLPFTVWGGFQLPSLGVFATREGLVAQVVVLVGLVGSALWTFFRDQAGQKPRPPASGAGAPAAC